MSSGYGLRTLSTGAAGYWPLSYHGGSVWAHDTAIAVSGLARDGHAVTAGALAEALVAAGAAFGNRMPELYGGDAREAVPRPVPYPAACRPQAWSAAAAVSMLGYVARRSPGCPRWDAAGAAARAGTLRCALRVSGLRVAGHDLTVEVDAAGGVAASVRATSRGASERPQSDHASGALWRVVDRWRSQDTERPVVGGPDRRLEEAAWQRRCSRWTSAVRNLPPASSTTTAPSWSRIGRPRRLVPPVRTSGTASLR